MRKEPNISIIIKPTFYNGDSDYTTGGKVNINNVGEFTSLQIKIVSDNSGSKHNVSAYKGNKEYPLDGLYFIGGKWSVDITNDVASGGSLSFIINEPSIFQKLYMTSLDSPYIDFFQGGFIVSILTDSEALFTGVIDKRPSPKYGNKGIIFHVPLVSYTKKLNDSIGVQTLSERTDGKEELITIVSKRYNFDDLLQQFIDSTVLKNALVNTNYYQAPQENPVGSGGTAIGKSSNIYIYSNPQDSKYNILMTSLYPYQRLFYTDGAGDFTITPMQYYYDTEQSWDISLMPQQDNNTSVIQLKDIDTDLNDCNIHNRVLVTWHNIFVTFNFSDPTGKENQYATAYTIATPNTEYFPRMAELVANGNNLQTKNVVNVPNANMLLDPAMLTILSAYDNLDNVSGLVNKTALIDGNLEEVTNVNADYNRLKYYLNFVALREMALILARETMISVTIDYNMIYHDKLNTHRKIPLNQIVKLSVGTSNRLFAGLQEFYCYKYEFEFNVISASVIKLYLIKPYTFMGLWSEEQVI